MKRISFSLFLRGPFRYITIQLGAFRECAPSGGFSMEMLYVLKKQGKNLSKTDLDLVV